MAPQKEISPSPWLKCKSLCTTQARQSALEIEKGEDAFTTVDSPNRKVSTLDVDRKIDARTARKVLDVHIATVLTAGDRTSALPRNFVKDVFGKILSDVDTLGLWSVGDRGYSVGIGRNEAPLTLVPLGEQFGGGCSPTERDVCVVSF
jgi:hypothetical protein